MCMNKRIDAFDILKGFGIICVILGHMPGDAFFVKVIRHSVFSFHMPLFFLISGYFLSMKHDYKDFIIDKAQKLLIPYYSTCAVICALSVPVSILLNQSAKNNLIKWIGGTIYAGGSGSIHAVTFMPTFIGAIWFLWALFWAFAIVRALFDKLSVNKAFVITLIMWFVGWQSSQIFWLPLDIQAGLMATIYLCIGYIVRQKDILSKKPMMPLILCGIVLWGGACVSQECQ